MSELRAFKLAAGYQDFGGGSFSYGGEGEAFDVTSALTGPDGEIDPAKVIVTDSVVLTNALAQYLPLEECPVPSGSEPVLIGSVPAETTVPEEQDVHVGVAAVHDDDNDEDEQDHGPHEDREA